MLTMNNKKQVILDGAIALHKERIVDVGTTSDLEKKYQTKKIINAQQNVIMPGLINGHTHAALTLFRGLFDDPNLWSNHRFLRAEKKYMNYDSVYKGTKLACLEMIQGGTTTFVDMYYFEDAVAKAATEIGIRCIAGHQIMDLATPDSKTPEQGLKYTKNFIKTWQHSDLITPAVAPHSIHNCSTKLLLAAKKLANMYRVPILMHLSEGKHEVEQSIKEHGLRPVVYLNSIGLLNKNLIAAHVIHVNNAEIVLLQQHSVGVINNPGSNMKLRTGVAPVAKMLRMGVLVGIGTDSSASNNALDMFAEIKTTSLLQKVTTGDPTVLNAYQTLELATIKGARALHMDKIIGSLERGKKADIIIVDLSQAHSKPLYNIASQLVYATKSSDVKTVIINGVIVLENKQFSKRLEQEVIHAQAIMIKKGDLVHEK